MAFDGGSEKSFLTRNVFEKNQDVIKFVIVDKNVMLIDMNFL